MELERANDNNFYVHVDPDFCFPNCFSVYNQVRKLLDEEETVILDFKSCTRMDSSAVGGLFSLKKSFNGGTNLKLINVNPHIEQIFSVYKLEKFFEFERI